MNQKDEKMTPLRAATASNSVSLAALPIALQGVERKSKTHLLELLAGVFNNVDDTLFELAGRADNSTDQNMYFESMREVRIRRRGIELSFSQALVGGLKALMGKPGPVEKKQPEKVSGESLSLVDHQELEQIVAFDSMVAKADVTCREQLSLLTVRMGSLLPHRELNSTENPVSPQVLAKIFVSSCEALEIDIRSRLMLFKLFDKQVLSALPKFYAACNKELASDGVLAHLQLADAYRSLYPEDYANLPKRGATSSAAEESVSAQQTATDSMHGQAVTELPDDKVGEDIFRTVQQLMTQLSCFQSAGSERVSLGPRAKVVSRAQVFDTFSQLQLDEPTRLPPTDESGYLTETPTQQDLKQASELLMKQLSAASGGQRHRIGQLDEDAINLVEMLFSYILDDDNLAPVMKALIARLQIPMIKVAMIDKALFNSTQHPARMLLNALAKSAIGWDKVVGKRRDTLYKKIESVIDRVIKEFKDDLSLFTDILADFAAFTEADERRARLVEQRTITAEQGRATAERARRQVDALLVDKIVAAQQGRDELPPVVVRFLGEAWSDVLFLICLREGCEGEQWQRAMTLVDNLLWSVTPMERESDRQRLLKVMPSLLKSLRSGLEQTGHSDFDTNRLFDQLEELHQANIRGELHVASEQQQQKMAESTEEIKPTSLDEALAGGGGEGLGDDMLDTCSDEETLALVDKMVAGSWVEVCNEQEQLLRARLAAIIKSTDRYIFVNRAGIKVADWVRDELANEIVAGKVKMLESGQLFDRALESVIGNLRQMQDRRQR